jgi:hypothetical protein
VPKNSNNTRQSADYYNSIVYALIDCNNSGMTYKQMASELNARQLMTPTGLRWTDEHIKGLLKKLRAYRTYPSYIHTHIMEMIFEKQLTLKQSMPLFQTKYPGTQ